ncbi:PASTA domain-containing protein [Methanosarcina mazei]|nr:PASTA domain-containing protein [Methanosarcina mazei]
MKAQLEQRLVELRAEYESGQKIFKDIEAKIVELENRKKNLNETLLRISGAIELLEEVLGEDSKNEVTEVSDTESQDTESQNKNVEVPFVVRLPLEKAVKKLEESGLLAGNIGEKSIFVAGVHFGDVIQQEPKGGMLADRGSTVDLIVATKGKLKPNLGRDSPLCQFSKH